MIKKVLKILAYIIIGLFLIGLLGSIFGDTTTTDEASVKTEEKAIKEEIKTAEQVLKEAREKLENNKKKIEQEQKQELENMLVDKKIPDEYKKVFLDSQSFLNDFVVSKSQLLEYLNDEGYSKKEIDYAIKNIDVDFKEKALEKAYDYNIYHLSKLGLYEVLISDAKFTKDEAKYAVDNAKLNYNEIAILKANKAINFMKENGIKLDKKTLYVFLTKEEKFTKDEAEYAIKNLNKWNK